MNTLVIIIAVCVLIFVAAFFSCTETAITAITKTDKRKLSPEKDKSTLHLISIKDQIVSATLIGTNLVNNIITSLVTAFTISTFTAKNATVISTAVITFLIIFFAEILPKSLATYKALKIIKTSTPALQLVRFIFAPITVLLSGISAGVLKLLSVINKNKKEVMTDEQLQALVDISTEDGTLDASEQKLLTGAIRLRELKLRNIITPLLEVESINANTTVESAVLKFCETKFSRLPVCRDDDTNSIIGMLHYKDLLFADAAVEKITDIMRDVIFIPETASVFKVIDTMKSKHTNIIVAIDEYGQNIGIATMDDIITAVFGTVKDEYDTSDDTKIVMIDKNRFRIAGDAKLYEVNKALKGFGIEEPNLDSPFSDTIAGLILETAEALPAEGSVIGIGTINFTIEKISMQKIISVIADTTAKGKN